MTHYLIEPRDTVLFRDARPFTASAGAETMPVPWPSTVAGLLRGRAALDERGMWAGDSEHIRHMHVAGPWLAELRDDGTVLEYYFPAPADAVFFEGTTELERQRCQLSPLHSEGPFTSDLPLNRAGAPMLPVGLRASDVHRGKPQSGPTWWKESMLRAWLETGSTADASVRIADIGITLPPAEERVHVAMNADTNTALDGQLFVTTMQRFSVQYPTDTRHRRFAIAAFADPNYRNDTFSGGTPAVGPVVLGGERRISVASRIDRADTPPLLCDLGGVKTLRIVLLTPALFEEGWRPNDDTFGNGHIVAGSTRRPEPISGWDLQARGPKQTRYMVPAGAVYWVSFPTAEDAHAWAATHHFTCISDDAQDKRDGFGLIAVGRGE